MKILYTGGQKSGKSRLAESRALALSDGKKPYYIATSEIMDTEMENRIITHKAQRENSFTTIETPTALYDTLSMLKGVILVECLSVWINNMLYYGKDEVIIYEEILNILALDKTIVFVLNEVGGGIVPQNQLARRFIDISGKIGQTVAMSCTEVYLCAVGLGIRLK